MQRLRLKADGRIVEVLDGREIPLVPEMPSHTPSRKTAVTPVVRDLRLRAKLTQAEFASRLGVPLETIRNWEQGRRRPRGPARVLLNVIAREPEAVMRVLRTEAA